MKPLNATDPLTPQDPLWDLLGAAPLCEPPAWLAARTLARLRREQEKPTVLMARLRWISAASVALILVTGFSTWEVQRENNLKTAQLKSEALNYLATGAVGSEDTVWGDTLY